MDFETELKHIRQNTRAHGLWNLNWNTLDKTQEHMDFETETETHSDKTQEHMAFETETEKHINWCWNWNRNT